MSAALHTPIDFDRRQDVLCLGHALGSMHMAVSIVLRLWADWGRNGKEWRPVSSQSWEAEPLAHVLEEIALYQGERGSLIQELLTAGVMAVEMRGDIPGLTLAGFWKYNEHLSPDFQTIQQRGGRAKAALNHAREMEGLARRQVDLMSAQGKLDLLFAADVTPEQRQRATALVMKLDAVCGLPMRDTASFLANQRMVNQALHVVRRRTLMEIDEVCRYLLARRSDPDRLNDPDVILRGFDELIDKTK